MDGQRDASLSPYICPLDKVQLFEGPDGLDGARRHYAFISGLDRLVPDFRDLSALGSDAHDALRMYDFEGARSIYRNFLNWLFRTFDADEALFRADLVRRLRLKSGARVLVTGCGLGEDVIAVLDQLGTGGSVFALDLSPEMVVGTYHALKASGERGSPVGLCVADACHLPFSDAFFDATYHFGGINLFDDVKRAVSEMARVTKTGGRVVFGDEGVAPWLRDTDYGRMVVANNRLWAAEVPLGDLPFSAVDPVVSWVLGNCFYVVEFTKSPSGPHIDPDVAHLGLRGGTMRRRYYGQLEGVDPDTKAKVMTAAAAERLSVAEWLQRAIDKALPED